MGVVAAASVLGLWAGQASAHHSFAMFDRTHDVVLKGTVREFQWTNPHSFIEPRTDQRVGIGVPLR